jgi:hypothetical protein
MMKACDDRTNRRNFTAVYARQLPSGLNTGRPT